MEKNILIVDDEIEILNIFEDFLTGEGYKVYKADNAADALKLFEDNSIKVMICDIKMPGMCGDELCWNVKKINNNVKVFAMTGLYSNLNNPNFDYTGFDGILRKPISLTELKTVIDNSFNKNPEVAN